MGADRRDRAAELLELNQRIMEAMPGGIVHVAADGQILTANAEALRVLGMSFDAATARYTRDWEPETIWENGAPCANEDYPVTRAIVTGVAQPPTTIGIRRPDGGVSWAVFTAVPVTDPETGAVTGAIVTFLDITERKRLEGRLRMSDRMATLGMLSASVAHEINNPLTYVMTNLDMIARAMDPRDETTARRAREALEGAQRIRGVVRDFGAFSQARDLSVGATDVHEVLEFCARMAHGELRQRATLVRDYDRSLPPVAADASRLGQVLLNLIMNAVQAIPPGDAERNRVELATRRTPDGMIEVSITDTGSGIAPAVLERVFEPFVTTKDAGEGTGLGLSISRDLVLGLRGELTLDSAVGCGTCAKVRLPASAQRARSAVDDAADSQRPPARILVIDDEPAIRASIAAILERDDVTTAGSGRSAIEALDSSDYDLVLCDLLMPEVTGMAVYEHALRRRPELARRFVFMTGAARSERAVTFLRTVESSVVEKPFGVPELMRAIDDALRTSAPARR